MSIPITTIDLIPSAAVDAGEVFCGALDSSLSKDGLKGLKKTVQRKSGWHAVISSPLQRCTVFAKWLADRHELPLVENKAFREMNFGKWEGGLPHVILQEQPDKLLQWWADPAQLKPPGGESYSVFRKRVLQGWAKQLREYKGQHILLVTHPGVMRVILCEIMGIPSQRFFSLHIDHGKLSQVQVVHDEGGDWARLVTHGC